jgi:F0F1-type ATP synthase assembly protein I
MEQPKQPNQFLKYSNLAIQMGLIIGLSSWGGHKLDQHYHNSKPVLTIILSLLGICTGMYIVLKDLIRPKNK